MHVSASSILYSAAAFAVVTPLGCAQSQTIPAGAKIVGAGVGHIGYVAEENGSVYLFDVELKRRIFDARILRGDEVVVEPEQDKIEVAGKMMEHKTPLKAERIYRVYFDRNG